MDLTAIERLVRLMAENDLVEIEVKNGPDHQVRLSRRSAEQPPMVFSAPAAMHAPFPARPAGDAAPDATASAGKPNDGTREFMSPMVGTFYRAASPEAPPYVKTGDTISVDTVICIIEAMKVMNEIKAEMKGEIVDVLVENGEAVEYGQPLFLIRPLA